jgi:hypothetical protein
LYTFQVDLKGTDDLEQMRHRLEDKIKLDVEQKRHRLEGKIKLDVEQLGTDWRTRLN